MAYSFGPWDDALDNLSLNYTDGVPVRIAEPFQCEYDFGEVDEILRKTNPNVLLDDVAYDCSLERKVLGDYEKHRQEREERKRVREEKIRKYEEKKREEVERKRREEEEKALEDERKRLEEIEAENLKAENERKRLEEEAENKRLEQEAQLKLLQTQAEEAAAAAEALNTDSPKDPEENTSTAETNDNNEEPSNEPIEDSNSDNKANASATTTSSFPESSNEINVIGTQSNTPTNVVINFSEFEREADPFADLELKTINDMEALQSISQSVSQQLQHQQQQQQHHLHQQQQQPNAAMMTNHQQSTLSNLHGFTPSSTLNSIPNYTPPYSMAGYTNNYQAPYQFSFPNHPPGVPGVPPSNQHPPGVPPSNPHLIGASGSNPTTPPILGGQMYMRNPSSLIPPSNQSNPSLIPSSGQSDPRNPYAFSPPGVYNPYQPRPTTTTQLTQPATRTEKLKDHDNDPPPGELKPSRSLGDMINELQREAKIVQEAKRKSSRTPPLRPSSTSTGMENWSPWPDLDPSSSSSVNGVTAVEETDALDGLDAASVEVCRQLHEMGFPLSRLAVGVNSVGKDTQKLINFCLVVDQLVEGGHEAEAAEKAASLHDADVEASKKHLDTFRKLCDFGFASKDIHEALVQQKGDYNAALELLIS